jgi:hypothetical protein
LLPAYVGTEPDVIDAFFVVFRFAIDHCVVRLKATFGLVNRLAVPPFAIGGGDAEVQSGGAVCHEIPLNPILRIRGTLTVFSNRNRSKIVTSSRNPHVWLRFENWRREWDSNLLENVVSTT